MVQIVEYRTYPKGPGGLVLHASFDEIGGLSVRAPVVISGVKVGQVARIELGLAEHLLDPELSRKVRESAAY